MHALELCNVSYTYQTQYQKVEALRSISTSFDQGKVYAIVGKSGSGKTTLLSLLAGLDLPSQGEVLCQGTPTSQVKLETYRREQVAVIYQNFRLFPKEARTKAQALIERVGLPEAVSQRFPTMLSGGEQQRVAIARALGMDTHILLADEPTGNLDTSNSENIFSLLQGLAHQEGYCVILVTHDRVLAGKADQVLELHDGQLVF